MSSPTSKIWQYSSTTNGIESHLTLTSRAVPSASQSQHLLEILHASLNPIDFKPAEVPYIGHLLVRKPATPGIDIAARIITPAASSPLQPGQLVFGAASTSYFAAGGLAEHITAPTSLIVPLPSGVDSAHAASLPLAGLTAYQAIVPYVKAGDRVVVVGGSGGTGTYAIQVAKAVGCWVVATCSAANEGLCRALGADEVVDYTKGDVVGALKRAGGGFGLVVDNVGQDEGLYWRCHEYSAPGARFVLVGRRDGVESLVFSIKAQLWPGFLGGGRRKLVMFFAQPDAEQLEVLGRWMSEGKIKAQIDSRYPFEQVPDAFRRLKTGRARGKIVVDVAA